VHSDSGNSCCALRIITDGTYCKYHIVIIPKYRKKKLYGKLREHVGEVIREVCRQRGVEVLEGYVMPYHI
jgi:putative transposase